MKSSINHRLGEGGAQLQQATNHISNGRANGHCRGDEGEEKVGGCNNCPQSQSLASPYANDDLPSVAAATECSGSGEGMKLPPASSISLPGAGEKQSGGVMAQQQGRQQKPQVPPKPSQMDIVRFSMSNAKGKAIGVWAGGVLCERGSGGEAGDERGKNEQSVGEGDPNGSLLIHSLTATSPPLATAQWGDVDLLRSPSSQPLVPLYQY